MGAFYETIPASLHTWILKQKVFWVGTAPLSPSGHINISPKGGEYFGILDNKTFWYIDLSGSGIESISHLREPENGRITVQFNAFEGPPQIVRLWGKGEVLEYGTSRFEGFVEQNKIDAIAGTRAIILVHIHQVGSSCGFSMPVFDFKAFRPTLNEYFGKRVASDMAGNRKDGIERYWAYKNSQSMDGLPGMQRAIETSKKDNIKPIKKMVGAYALEMAPRSRPGQLVPLWSLVVVMLLSFSMGSIAALLAALQLGLLVR